jgi:hypothetical protein
MANTSPQAGSQRDHMDLTATNLHKLLTSSEEIPTCSPQHKGPGATMERWLHEADTGFTGKARDRQRLEERRWPGRTVSTAKKKDWLCTSLMLR